MKRLIITADDYGMSPAVNNAINEGVDKGIITTTNVMVGMSNSEDAINLKKKNHDISIGLHWTLTAGRPVSRPSEISSLIDDDGFFYCFTEFKRRYAKNLIKDKEIIIELKAQYNRFFDLCGRPDYWNTHQNVHVAFKLFSLFIDIAEELDIRVMRNHNRIYVPSSNAKGSLPLRWKLMEPAKRLLLQNWQKKADKRGILSADGIMVPMNKNDKHNLDYLLSNLVWNQAESVEYVLHPATHVDCDYFGTTKDERIKEYQLVTSDKTKEVFRNHHIILSNFRYLID